MVGRRGSLTNGANMRLFSRRLLKRAVLPVLQKQFIEQLEGRVLLTGVFAASGDWAEGSESSVNVYADEEGSYGIDWGDGSNSSVDLGSSETADLPHTYADDGYYT